MIAVGRPSASSAMPSCVQHDVHDPQSPIAVTVHNQKNELVLTGEQKYLLRKRNPG